MPGYYEGAPAAEISLTLLPKDLAKAKLMISRQMKPVTKPWVRAGMLFTASLLFLAILPYYWLRYGNFWVPVLLFLLFFGASLWARFRLPKLEEKGLEQKFATNKLRLLETKVTLYRDSFKVENEFQRFEGSWAEFSACYEDKNYIAAVGSGSYPLLVLKKEQMPKEQQEQASLCLQNYFAGRYKKML